jgi:hypothetical protein
VGLVHAQSQEEWHRFSPACPAPLACAHLPNARLIHPCLGPSCQSTMVARSTAPELSMHWNSADAKPLHSCSTCTGSSQPETSSDPSQGDAVGTSTPAILAQRRLYKVLVWRNVRSPHLTRSAAHGILSRVQSDTAAFVTAPALAIPAKGPAQVRGRKGGVG